MDTLTGSILSVDRWESLRMLDIIGKSICDFDLSSHNSGGLVIKDNCVVKLVAFVKSKTSCF